MGLETTPLIDEIATLVERACRQEANPFGYSIWPHHTIRVVAHAQALARRLGADEEIVTLAALLHDYASISGHPHDEHHLRGAHLATELLLARQYPEARAEHVAQCILTHRGSVPLPRESVEANILASADAMAHFDNVPSLLYLAYTKRGLDSDEGARWVLDKLARSWRKLLPEAQEMMRAKYEAIRRVLSGSS